MPRRSLTSGSWRWSSNQTLSCLVVILFSLCMACGAPSAATRAALPKPPASLRPLADWAAALLTTEPIIEDASPVGRPRWPPRETIMQALWRVQQRQAQVRVDYAHALAAVDHLLTARSSCSGQWLIASEQRLARARGRLFGLHLQLPVCQQRIDWTHAFPLIFGDEDDDRINDTRTVRWPPTLPPSPTDSGHSPALVRFARRLERLHRLHLVGRMRASKRTWAVTLHRERQRVMSAYAALTPADRVRVRGLYERILAGQPPPRDSELADLRQLAEQDANTESFSRMDPTQKVALQRYARAISAHRFLDRPLALHPDAFAVTPSARSWTTRRAQQLADQLERAADQVYRAGVALRLVTLVEKLASLTAARALPLPRRIDARNHAQLRLLDTLLAQLCHLFFVQLSQEERSWMREWYDSSVRSWSLDAAESH